MKQVICRIKGDKCKIQAEGMQGKGTEAFTEKLAKDLGEIVERHKGHHHHDHEDHDHVHQHN